MSWSTSSLSNALPVQAPAAASAPGLAPESAPAQTATSTPTPPASKPNRTRILACRLCQLRKTKCDRKFPCGYCKRSNVQCVPSTPAPPRKRKKPNEDLQIRLARCEELLKIHEARVKQETEAAAHRAQEEHVQGGSNSDISNYTPNSYTPSLREQSIKGYPLHEEHHGKLVEEDGGVRFMDSRILGTIYEELREMRNLVDADDDDDEGLSPETPAIDDNSELLIGSENTPASSAPEYLWPDSGSVSRLWLIYLERVNPLTKIIHVPSLLPYVTDAASGPAGLPKNYEALLFSIFLMAAVAMSPEECQAILGCSRNDAIQRFSNGVRMALIRLNFLKNHEMVSLQALVIYLISLQGRYNRHAAWVLNGVVIRIAQKMGLHRDGELLGLGPFECEMRRRLWWQIIMLDGKYAMMSGLSQSLLPRIWDTREPKNINDCDMYPSATEPFEDKDGPTEMIFVLITNKIARFLCNTPSLELMLMLAEWSDAPPSKDPRLAEFRDVISKLAQDLLAVLSKYCDPRAGPVHQMAILLKEQILQKLTRLATPLKEQPEWGDEILDDKDNAFKIAVCALEHDHENYAASSDKGFLWHALLHFQLDVFVFVAGQLCSRVEGNLVDRAWKQVEVVYEYHPAFYETANKTYFRLARFILIAWSKREEAVLAKTGRKPDMPACVARLLEIMPSEEIKTEQMPAAPVYGDAGSIVGPDLSFPDVSTDDFWLGTMDTDGAELNMLYGIPSAWQTNLQPHVFGSGQSHGGW